MAEMLDERSSRGQRAAIAVAVLAAVAVGGFLRFHGLADVPPGLNQDEAVNGYDAYSLLLTGRDHHGHPFPFAGLESFGDWASPLLTFLTVPAVGLFGLNVAAIRGVAAAVGVLLIPAVYLLGEEIFRRRAVGVVAAWLVAVSPWHVHLSRLAIPPTLVPTAVALSLLALLRAGRSGDTERVVVASIAAALAIGCYPTMKLYIPLLLLAALAIYLPVVRRMRVGALVAAAGILLLAAGPIYYLSLADPGGRARLDQVSVFQRDIGVLFLLRQVRTYVSPWVLFVAGNGHPGHSATPPGYGIELRSTLPFLLVGGVWLALAVARRRPPGNWRPLALLAAALVLYPVPGSVTLPTPPLVGPQLFRAAQLIPLFALVAAAGIVATGDRARALARRLPGRAARPALALAVCLLGALIGQELLVRYAYYYTDYARREDVSAYFQVGLGPALAFARAHQAEYDEIWVDDANQAYIYVLFGNRWPPSDVHERLQPHRMPPEFNSVDVFDKYRFVDGGALEAGDFELLYTAVDAAGRPRYEVRRGQVAGHGRVLVVARP